MASIRWDKQKLDELQLLINEGLTNKEIAEILNTTRAAVTIIVNKKLKIKNQNYILRSTKHKHLQKDVIKFFLSHTAKETQKRFNLTESEFKSCMTYAYKIKSLKSFRKDTRRRDAWSSKEYQFLLQNAGIQSRDWIAKKLKRGGRQGIKDRLESLGVSSKNLNGITASQFRQAFGCEPDFFIQTNAGPPNLKHSTGHFKLVPWVFLDMQLATGKLKTHKIFADLVATMAMFQNWYFEGKAYEKLVSTIISGKKIRL